MRRILVAMFLAVVCARALAVTPVVFIHGWNSDGDIWDDLCAELVAHSGYVTGDFDVWSYYGWRDADGHRVTIDTPIESIAEVAAQRLIDKSDAFGGPVDVVAHSMGGLVVRAALTFGYLTPDRINHFITLGTPHYGELIGIDGFSDGKQTREMAFGSTFLSQLYDDWFVKSNRIERTFCIVGLGNASEHAGALASDGLVLASSAALTGCPVLYVRRYHSDVFQLLGDAIYACPDGAKDPVRRAVAGFLTNDYCLTQAESGWTPNSGAVPMTPMEIENPAIVLDAEYGVFQPGKKVELQLDETTVGCSVKGLPSGFKFSKKTGRVTGAAKKGDVVKTVTFTKKIDGEKVSATTVFRVGPLPRLTVIKDGAENAKVKGAGGHLIGKKIGLSVTVPKGAAFLGWYRDGEPFPDAKTYEKRSVKFKMPEEDFEVVARLVPESVTIDVPLSEPLTVGESCEIPVTVTSVGAIKSVSFKGLPKGVKYDSKRKCLKGAPKKAGTFVGTVTAKTKYGYSEKKVLEIVVEETPAE